MFSLSSLYTILFLAAFSSTIQSNKFCGTDLDDASEKCWQPCTTDEDCRKCAVDLSCYDTGETCSSLDTTGTNHFYCGTSWCDAAYKCSKPCPNGGWNTFDGVLESECPEGESCFADIPCDSNVAPAPVPELPQPPTSAPFQFCGSSLEDAQTQCWQPCPRGSSDCCFGQECFDYILYLLRVLQKNTGVTSIIVKGKATFDPQVLFSTSSNLASRCFGEMYSCFLLQKWIFQHLLLHLKLQS